MATNSYPNITLTSTTVTATTDYNGAIITSTLGAAELTLPAVLPAGFSCWIVQLGAGAVAVTAGSGASVNNTTGKLSTNGQFAAMKVIAVADGTLIVTGDVA